MRSFADTFVRVALIEWAKFVAIAPSPTYTPLSRSRETLPVKYIWRNYSFEYFNSKLVYSFSISYTLFWRKEKSFKYRKSRLKSTSLRNGKKRELNYVLQKCGKI